MSRAFLKILAATSICFALSTYDAVAQSVTVQWDPSPDATVTGYYLSWGRKSGSYDHTIKLGQTTTYTVTGLEPGVRYFFAVQAYSSASLTSGFSNEVIA